MRTSRTGEPVRLLLADPPWRFGDSLPGPGRGAVKHYATMRVEDIERFPLPPLADDALLLLWRVAAMPEEALRVARAWGFEPKSEIVWAKTGRDGKRLAFGMGRYARNCHEACMVAARGRAASLVADHAVRSLFFAPLQEHSRKPEKFYRIAERLFPGPRCELFARGAPRPGWLSYGLQAEGRPANPGIRPA